ncbi:hypothetical protein [Parvibaculum sp. MBR-TMA-1.3b-4.2]|jgi:hypothetical protein
MNGTSNPASKRNGARHPVHIVDKRRDPPAGTPRGGPARYAAGSEEGARRPAVTLPEIPSLARNFDMTLEDGFFMHAVALAAEAMLEGAEADEAAAAPNGGAA